MFKNKILLITDVVSLVENSHPPLRVILTLFEFNSRRGN